MRIDITGPHDLVEEVVRILGYEKVEEILPRIKLDSKINDIFSKMLFARNKLLYDGYSEVMTYVFRDKGELEVLASASDKKFLRTNLSDGLKESIKLNILNIPLLDMDEVKVFEIGTVFLKKGEEIHIAYGDKKNVMEMTLEKFISKEMSEGEFPYEMTWERDGASTRNFSVEKYPCISEGDSPEERVFKPWSMYPFITRDIAVWVPEGTPPEKLTLIYKSFGTGLLVKEPKLFDSFTKNKRTSYAFRLVFQSYDRTLTDEEVNQIMSEITEKIVLIGWEVR